MSDDRLAEIVAGWRASAGNGSASDPEVLFRAHPDLADELRVRLAAMDVLDQLFAEAATPEHLGEYRILREVGRGGMGVVYEAEQASMRRRVALKVLYPSVTNTPQAVKRFQQEARAAGRLKHTSIAAVHALGRERGVWFCAMELVDGEPLGEVIARMREEARPPGDSDLASRTAGRGATHPSPRSAAATYYQRVAEVFAEVAEGLQVAHEHGVIHRDIKPGNLLLDAEGSLRIVDFGLARLDEDESGMTRTGDVLGTPLYMSPEQMGLRRTAVDARSDIYSLGATMYETLTLRPPHDVKSVAEITRSLQTRTPAAPRRFDRALPRDLETIVLKALEADPASRYGSAGKLARDLRRFSVGEAIRARPVGAAGRAWRHVKRHRLRSGLVALLLVALAFAGGFGIKSARESARSAHLEYERLVREAEGVGLVDADAAIELYGRAIRLDPTRPDAFFGRARDLGIGAPTPRTFEERWADLARAEGAGAPRRTVAYARANLLLEHGRTEEAAEHARRAPHATDVGASGLLEEARYLRFVDRGDEADRLLSEAVETSEPAGFARHGALRTRASAALAKGRFDDCLADLQAARASLPRGVWDPYLDVGVATAWLRMERPVQADAVFERALQACRESGEAWPWDRLCRGARESHHADWIERATTAALAAAPESASMLGWRSEALWRAGELDQALEVARKAVALSDGAPWALNDLGSVLNERNELEEARLVLERALQAAPGDHRAACVLGMVLTRLGDPEGGKRLGLRAIALRPTCPAAHWRLSLAHLELGELEAAIGASRRGIRLGDGHEGYTQLANALGRSGDHEGALAAYQSAHDRHASTLTRCNLAAGLRRVGKKEEALAVAEEAVRSEPSDPLGYFQLALARRALGDQEGAGRAYEEVLARDPRHMWARCNLAVLCWKHLDAPDRARELFPSLYADHGDNATVLVNYGGFLTDSGRPREAIDVLKRAVSMMPEHPTPLWNLFEAYRGIKDDDGALDALESYTRLAPADTEGWLWRGLVLQHATRHDEALACFMQAVELGCDHPVPNNAVAWYLANDPGKRDPQRAVRLANQAVAHDAENPGLLNTLGVAHVRAGAYAEGLKVLEEAMEKGSGGSPHDWVFVALAKFHLGKRDEARVWLQKTEAWIAAHRAADPELDGFVAEVRALLPGS